jgi:hypothetical protein
MKIRVALISGLAALLITLPALGWQLLDGAAVDIGVGANGAVWVVGTNPAVGGFGIWQRTPNGWVNVPGGATEIAVDPQGNPWVVNAGHEIYRRVGNDFQRLPGAAVDIGIGANGAVWVIGTNPAPGGFGIYRWNGMDWSPIDGGAVRIAVGQNGDPWVVNVNHQIFHRGSGGWQLLDGAAWDIGVGADGTVWAIGTNPVPGGFGIWRRGFGGWEPVPGGAVRISVDPAGRPWVVNDNRQIFAPALEPAAAGPMGNVGDEPIAAGDPEEVTATTEPPDPVYEQQTDSPNPGYVWVGGYWGWNGVDWGWNWGRWESPPAGNVYIEPYYERVGDRVVYVRGYWGRPDAPRRSYGGERIQLVVAARPANYHRGEHGVVEHRAGPPPGKRPGNAYVRATGTARPVPGETVPHRTASSHDATTPRAEPREATASAHEGTAGHEGVNGHQPTNEREPIAGAREVPKESRAPRPAPSPPPSRPAPGPQKAVVMEKKK